MDTPITRREALGALGALALPLGLQGLPTPADATPVRQTAGPDLANLHPTVEWMGRAQPPRLSFIRPEWRALEPWKSEAREALLRHLAFDPPAAPVSARVVASEERDGLRREEVRIRVSPAYEIPAMVLAPSGRTGRLPAVVALHCHGGQYRWGWRKLVSSPDDPPPLVDYRDRLYGRPYPELLARRGFVVIVADAFYFGERRLRADQLKAEVLPGDVREAFRGLPSLAEGSAERVAAENRVAGAYEAAVTKGISAAGATWPGLLTWDDRRTVDYLRTRPDVDPERIGCMGLSGGGLRSAQLMGADPRIRAGCVTAWMTSWEPMLPLHARRHTWMAFVPGLGSVLDLPDVASLVAPGALLVQQCARDTLFPMEGMRSSVEKLTAVYAKLGIPERFRGSFHDVPHSFPPALQEEAFDWLARWL